MNHGIVNRISELLALNGPSSAKQLADKIEPPEMWDAAKLHRNVACLMSEYARRGRWRKLKRGLYAVQFGGGQVDITFHRFTETDAQLAAYGINLRDAIESRLRSHPAVQDSVVIIRADHADGQELAFVGRFGDRLLRRADGGFR